MENKMIAWFLLLKRQTKIYIIIGAVIFLIMAILIGQKAYWKYQYYKEQESKVRLLEDEKQQLLKDVKDQKTQITTLKDTIFARNVQYNELKKLLKPLNDERQKIPSIVRNYPDRKLDSILTNHKHTQRDYKGYFKGAKN